MGIELEEQRENRYSGTASVLALKTFGRLGEFLNSFSMYKAIKPFLLLSLIHPLATYPLQVTRTL